VRRAVCPGSFDPVTLGHLDVIGRAAKLFDEVRVVVVHNPSKQAFLPATDRVALIARAVTDAGITGTVVVDEWTDGLLVDYCTKVGAQVLVKGIRAQVDLAYETPMAIVNRDLAGVETVFVLSDPVHAQVSSSLVREVFKLGGDISPYVPPAVSRKLKES